MNVMVARQLDHGVNDCLRAEAAWVLLDRDSWHLDVPRCAPLGEYAVNVIVARTIEHFQESLVMLERISVAGESLSSELGRQQSAAGALADMHRFGHRTEIRFDAGGKRSAER